MFGASGRSTSTVLVDGRFLKRDGRLITVDPTAARERSDASYAEIARRIASARLPETLPV